MGFRPFIYNLARSLGVKGFVLNDSTGVVIEAEGDRVEEFIEHIRTDAPPRARIDALKVLSLARAGYTDFEIRESIGMEDITTLISPDISICKDCLEELFDPSNRRYLYPFINCTNCGPRYSIIFRLPYDRPNTTMSQFRMCRFCEEEYHDPSNRRFHAQPNACPECGPQIEFKVQGSRFKVEKEDPLKATIELLKDGAIVAIKGLGGFHLACDATNDDAVRRLRDGKRRSNKPFAVMMPDVRTVRLFCEVGDEGEGLLTSPENPIVLLEKKDCTHISELVAPDNNYLGVMLPYTPLHHLLFRYPMSNRSSLNTHPHFSALVMTSGNISEEPIVTDNDEAMERLSHVADAFLLHNRDIYMRVDDSVARVSGFKSQISNLKFQISDLRSQISNPPFRIIRRARGYAPSPIELGFDMPEILATGGELKTTFCLTKGRYAIMSQHIGDMENLEAIGFYKETLNNLKGTFEVEPSIIAHDMHPNYWTTTFAEQLATHEPSLSTIPVQHHHAHIVSCMAENGLSGRVIGVALDGTGYGTDGRVWGGEFMIAGIPERERTQSGKSGFERFAHLEYLPMPGGERAIKEPYRMAVSYLYHTFGQGCLDVLPSFFDRFDHRMIERLIEMMDRGIRSLLTSSCGRLFDAVASILGIRDFITFEAEGAIGVEMRSLRDVEDRYGFAIKEGEPYTIDLRPMIVQMVDDLRRGLALHEVGGRFHNTIAAVVIRVAGMTRKETSIDRVCLTGGCFQNEILIEKSVAGLMKEGFKVFIHKMVPSNDGGISLGQAVVAASVTEGALK